MYIRTVEIENYRAFKNFEIKFSPLSVIIGENEAGKTNLFDALALPLNNNDISFNKKRLSVSDINREAIKEFYQAIINGKDDDEIKLLIPKVRVEVEFTEPKNIIEEGVIGKWIIGEEADDSYKIRYDFKPKDTEQFVKAAKKLLEGIGDIKDTRWFNLPIELYDYDITQSNNGLRVSYSDLRLIGINSINAERDDFAESNTQKSNDILTKMLISALEDSDKAKINSAYTSFFDAIENTETFTKIVTPDPDFENFFDEIVDKLECIPNLPNLKSILSNITLKSGESYLYQRGLGYRNLVYIYLLFEFFRGNKNALNLCCIEEPEAHLSVNNLRFATDFIYKSTQKGGSSLQTLISSHSPLVINKLELTNVIVLSGNNAIHLIDSKKHLTNYLRKRPNFDILKLLLSNKTVLVEGTTEEMLINAILYRNNENVSSLEVISIEQTGFTTFMDVWLQVNKGNTKKKLSIIRDYDDNDSTKDKHQKYDTDNDNIRVRTTTKYTLEDDLAEADGNLGRLNTLFKKKYKTSADMAEFLKKSKAERMLRIADSILDEENKDPISLPKHIQEALDFMK
ncbi:AAA family ATPase [Vibrio sp. 431]|uniref:ATP-dependent nuclease n=1 Tax=Vibrio TaxID=662 RepID=UPI0015B6AAF0|nr:MULTISPECIES: AAA family ATPase [Vibrio]ELA9390907.1 AAA family ATPase [Vibrio parahaemolyticus]EJL6793680.1 AAA family ATPase [Vibrio alginolyticus]MBE4058730.1 AAA family ATPase [Vibrio parahaemolyticus]MCR9639019.1 AAA family ATPase [Vibrio alginolyticus]MDF4878789.1 AAA family ATPase [Vibrio parahaemolyticus]